MSSELPIDIETRDGATIVRPTGEVDLARSPILRHTLGEVIGDGVSRLVLDLSGVDYMDSSGVATLVEALQQCRSREATLVLSGLQDRVRSVFEIAKLDAIFTIRADVDAALGD
jgi:anti-sigma B factor antagonist